MSAAARPSRREVPVAVVIDYIDAYRDRVVEGRRLGVEPIIEVLRDAAIEIAPSTYYATKNRTRSARAVRDADLLTTIRQVHSDNLGVYGARKVHAELLRQGERVARCTVERLMRADGLRGITREKTRRTTHSEGQAAYNALPCGGAFIVIENLIDDLRRENAFGLMMSLNMLIEFGDAFDFTGSDLAEWCHQVGFKKVEILPLAGPASAGIAYK